MRESIAEIADALGRNAEAVCRHYLSQGRREGRYWLVGDVRNSAGRSLYVRLQASPEGGAAGKWTDAASGEHGDLLDIIAAAGDHHYIRDTLAEARRFLGLARHEPPDSPSGRPPSRAPTTSAGAARRLFAASVPIAGTLAASYLHGRGIVRLTGCDSLRFHPNCYYWPSRDDAPGTARALPAMIAAVTDDTGVITGVHRTWLNPARGGKAPVVSPRRAMGALLGAGVRFGQAGDVMIAGEGIETTLSLRMILALPMIAGLSSAHLAALRFPVCLTRLYIARDRDAAGAAAVLQLRARAEAAGIELVTITPRYGDFNDDLRRSGIAAMRGNVCAQLRPEDRRSLLELS